VDVVALIFEGSDRGDSLVKRDYDLASMDQENMWGRRVDVEGCFMPKGSIESGLEGRRHWWPAKSHKGRRHR
jgi:hypothetical protein